MKTRKTSKIFFVFSALTIMLLLILGVFVNQGTTAQLDALNNLFLPIVINGAQATVTPSLGQYVVLGWNDLGMHCYNRDFQDLAVLPPYSN